MNAPYAGTVAQRNAHIDHLSALGNFDVALTVKLRRWDRLSLRRTTFDDHVRTAQSYLRRLNSELFGHGATRKGYCVASAVSYELGAYQDDPHLHFALESPANSPHFDQLLIDVARKIPLLSKNIDVRQMTTSEWLHYMIKTGPDSIIYSCCTRAILPTK
jgi:hypothetical protein